MKRRIELLAPGGDIDSIKAAIAAGADAVYCGLDKFNARNRAANISFEDLQGIIRLAHQNNCRIFLTLNIIVVENEIPAFIQLLNKLINTGIDGVIVQDLGMFYLMGTCFKGLQIHASTQLTTHNEGQIRFLNRLNASRVNLSRELNLQEIKELTTVAHQNKVLTEVFVHGSNCLSFSGLCYMSSIHGGNSGNRGRCSQPCRDPYLMTLAGKEFPLNLKDNSAWSDLSELADAGVDSLKIEGRIKKAHYVYTVVNSWKKRLQGFHDNDESTHNNSDLYKVFNRDFSNAYLSGDIHKDMFSDNPRDHSAIHRAELYVGSTDENIERAKQELYDEKTDIINHVRKQIESLSCEKIPLTISISGECNSPLIVLVKSPFSSFIVRSTVNLVNIGAEAISHEMLFKRLKTINDTEYYIEHLDLDNLPPDLYIPFKELTSIKKQLLFILNDSKEPIDPIEIPIIKNHNGEISKPTLSILISSIKDLNLCSETNADIYFQLPNAMKSMGNELIDLFTTHKDLFPWFPSVIIGEDYASAVEFLSQVRPKQIITNNTGIAWEAWQLGISWIAGPYLNLVNSFSLICLKENFNCAGAFLSNEMNKTQLQQIKKPAGFKLYYSIYHPLVLMTSRQCLFHQVTGCEKDSIDDNCIPQCEKSASITNLKKVTFCIEKSKGNYHHIYNETNYLNTDVVTDLPGLFSSYFIDIRDVKTNTKLTLGKSETIRLFENYINSKHDSAQQLYQDISPTTNIQYTKGI